MISAITAMLPAEGPSLTRTTRPTSTNRLKVDGCWGWTLVHCACLRPFSWLGRQSSFNPFPSLLHLSNLVMISLLVVLVLMVHLILIHQTRSFPRRCFPLSTPFLIPFRYPSISRGLKLLCPALPVSQCMTYSHCIDIQLPKVKR